MLSNANRFANSAVSVVLEDVKKLAVGEPIVNVRGMYGVLIGLVRIGKFVSCVSASHLVTAAIAKSDNVRRHRAARVKLTIRKHAAAAPVHGMVIRHLRLDEQDTPAIDKSAIGRKFFETECFEHCFRRMF